MQRDSLSTQLREPSMAPLQAEKRLMLAVLERAVDDFRTYAIVPTGRGRWLFMEAAAWFQSFATGAFDFEGICEATGLDPDFIRKRLRSWYTARCAQPRLTRGAKGQDRDGTARYLRSRGRTIDRSIVAGCAPLRPARRPAPSKSGASAIGREDVHAGPVARAV